MVAAYRKDGFATDKTIVATIRMRAIIARKTHVHPTAISIAVIMFVFLIKGNAMASLIAQMEPMKRYWFFLPSVIISNHKNVNVIVKTGLPVLGT